MKLLKEFGNPVAATSANLAGSPPGLNAQEAVAGLDGIPDVLIDGGSVKETGGRASTVISLLEDAPHVLREGPISLQEIIDAIG
jgi:tRNA A37 threonylcarbamoyladenosine synthetase subunit TsaC/SUA5/YrdC